MKFSNKVSWRGGGYCATSRYEFRASTRVFQFWDSQGICTYMLYRHTLQGVTGHPLYLLGVKGTSRHYGRVQGRVSHFLLLYSFLIYTFFYITLGRIARCSLSFFSPFSMDHVCGGLGYLRQQVDPQHGLRRVGIGPRRQTFPVFFLLSLPVFQGLCSTESSYPPPRFSHISMIFSHIHSPSISFCPFCCVLLLEQTWFLFSCYLKHASFPTVFPFSFLACGSKGGATLPCTVISQQLSVQQFSLPGPSLYNSHSCIHHCFPRLFSVSATALHSLHDLPLFLRSAGFSPTILYLTLQARIDPSLSVLGPILFTQS